MRVRFPIFCLVFLLLLPQLAAGQTSVVPSSELRDAVAAAAKARQKNLDDVRSFFSGAEAKAAMKSARVDYRKVDKAVATMSADELERLAAKTNAAQRDFAAGALSNQELTYIVIALATAVIVLLIVEG